MCIVLNHNKLVLSVLVTSEPMLSSLLLTAWDCSAWVRTYALYLDERVECFRVLKYDVEADRLVKLPQASGKVISAF